MKSKLNNIPLNPEKTPFFYGWIILALGITGVLLSVPGQTMGISVFTDDLLNILDLSRVDLSLAYMLGTIGSALLLTPAGKLLDKYGARTIGTAVTCIFGAVLIVLSRINVIYDFAKNIFTENIYLAAFILITAGFFLVRFFGQGLLTLTSRTMVMKWFDKKRGMANAFLGVFTSFGFSMAPRIFNDMISRSGWDGAWKIMGLFILAAGGILYWILARDNPKECGLKPDGRVSEKHKSKKKPSGHPGHDFTLKQARKTLPLWVFGLALGMNALWLTAFTFHIVSIFEHSGMTRIEAVGIFFPASIISVCVNFSVSILSDYIKLRYLAIIHTGSMILSMLFLSMLNPGVTLVMLIISYGIMGGIFNITNSIVWPRYYGTAHLGEINGMVMGFMVGGSALGPYFFSLIMNGTGSYAPASIICLCLTAVLLVLSFFIRRPVYKQ